MHQTKYRGIITEAGSLTFPLWESAEPLLVKPLRKSVSPFGGDLCFGWLVHLHGHPAQKGCHGRYSQPGKAQREGAVDHIRRPYRRRDPCPL